ncbi:Zinc finger, NF-X1-type [Lasallia pustulata]|uniref:Zinc finger, NF-X1-type n=1 Tax=Lasallia pustulata TaxID=136370 RepID=A0A1W5DEI5_9LECA|nr:Zinc finger, NF-X1-type [Lasallia pustulata]
MAPKQQKRNIDNLPRNRACKFFPAGQCFRGTACRYSHETTEVSSAPVTASNRPALDGNDRKLLAWCRGAPKSRTNGTMRPMDAEELCEFFHNAYELACVQKDTITHQVINTLASEGGLGRIQELTAVFERIPEGRKPGWFISTVLPFLRTITHKDITSSLLLEHALGTIYNFLFGIGGRRAVAFFRSIGATLINVKSDIEQPDSVLYASIAATLGALLMVLECNQSAALIPDFSEITMIVKASITTSNEVARGSLTMQTALTDLAKIERRLKHGDSIMPLEEYPRSAPDGLAPFLLHQDGPGALSSEGPRHDNDHTNISSIKIMPTPREIHSQRPEYLPVRDPARQHLAGFQGLLDRQFRLLREDTIGQLRDSVRMVLENLSNPKTKTIKEHNAQNGSRVWVYGDVELSDVIFDKRKALKVAAEFNQPVSMRKLTSEHQRKTWWDESKQLRADALLCLVDSEGRTIFLSVCSREGERDATPTPAMMTSAGTSHDKPIVGEELINSRIAHKSRDETHATMTGLIEAASAAQAQPWQAIPNLWTDPRRGMVLLQLIDVDEHDITEVLGRCHKDSNVRQVLVEFPGILLPSFRPTLEALQHMSTQQDFPFSDFLAASASTSGSNADVPQSVEIPPPAYALKRGFSFNLGAIAGDKTLRLAEGQRFDMDMLKKSTSLDDAQCHALVNALRRSLALIQGPPGTGKSYVAVQLVKVLLASRREAEMGPIICVCYTNHALDQFLEHLLADGTEQLIRMGGNSKSSILEPLNLRNVASDMERTKLEKSEAWECRNRLQVAGLEVSTWLSELKRADTLLCIQEYLEAHHPRHHEELFRTTDEDGFTTVQNRRRDRVQQWLGTDSNSWRPTTHSPSLEVLHQMSLWEMSSSERLTLHQYWVKEIQDKLTTELNMAIQEFVTAKSDLAICNRESDLRCLKQAHVIGVTTSGLAKNVELLRRLRAKVLLCEEAGEILEAHTLTALLPSVEHAIFIGDHEQLRPQVQNYDLSVENPKGLKYSLDVSLFERLINPPGFGPEIPHDTLQTQRRMDPSVARLVRETLYCNLQDHDCVRNYPLVQGIRPRLFWIDHCEPEAKADSTRLMQTSHSNDFEVNMVAALVTHVVRQGVYKSDEVAVLTPYVRQLQKIRTLLGQSFEIVVSERDQAEIDKLNLDDTDKTSRSAAVHKTTLLKSVRIATVDNFQGEEAEVVIVSLVRSNGEKKCGFLRTSNRINVLLSRARHGMYIIGNSETSEHVPMWRQVISILRQTGSIGRTLSLRCPRHPDTSIEVARPDDFTRLAPEGGCDKKCRLRLRCGHACTFKCHSMLLHDAVVCQEPCPQRRDTCGHSCPKKCGESCDKRCRARVQNVKLPCGHVEAQTECHKTQDPAKIYCCKIVKKTVPKCGHGVEVQCSHDTSSTNFTCSARCASILSCGHNCLRECRECRVKEDGVTTTIDHGKCTNQCGRPFSACAHSCSAPCHDGEPCPLCTRPCAVHCSHSRCGKECQEPCAPCAEPCTSGCHHNGFCQMPCAVPCDILPCSKRCEKFLDCGHQCPSVCGELCPTAEYCQTCASVPIKEKMVDYIGFNTYQAIDLEAAPVIIPSCGHLLTLSSMDGHMEMSKHYEMTEEGFVKGVISKSEPLSMEGLKACPICRMPLRNINRYNRIVKRGLIDEATKRFILWANARFVPLAARMVNEEERLRGMQVSLDNARHKDEGRYGHPSLPMVSRLHLSGSRDIQLHAIRQLSGLSSRYKPAFDLRFDIDEFLHQVSEEEQPFARVYQMVQNVRRGVGLSSTLGFDGTILQTRNRLLTGTLSIRCDLSILTDFVNLYRGQTPSMTKTHAWLREELLLDLSENRRDCMILARDASDKQQPMLEIEARILFAKFVALERAAAHDSGLVDLLLNQAREELRTAKDVVGRAPSTASMLAEIEDTEKMVRESTFYTTFTNEEKQAVYAAMAQDFRGTGHWYYCVNGHPFTVGECGMPMQTSVCPQCGEPVGGSQHQPVEGVRRAADMDEQFGHMTI